MACIVRGGRTVNVIKTGKWERETKTKNPTKRGVGKKKFFGNFGARESRPMSPTKKQGSEDRL